MDPRRWNVIADRLFKVGDTLSPAGLSHQGVTPRTPSSFELISTQPSQTQGQHSTATSVNKPQYVVMGEQLHLNHPEKSVTQAGLNGLYMTDI